MLSIRPTTSRLMARLRPPKGLFEAAARQEEIEPATSHELPPAISLPDELDRVTAFAGDPEQQRALLRGGRRDEGPTIAYDYDDALVADYTLYAGGTHQVYRASDKRPILAASALQLDRAQLCTTACAQNYFGHFFHDALPLEELAANRGLAPLTFARAPWLHEPGYRALFERRALATSLARVSRLSVVDERNLNGGWVARMDALRARLRAKVTPTGDRRVYITRGSLFSGRSLANEGQLAEALAKQGFRILEPENETPEAIAAILSGAELVASMTGSAQAHALVALPRGATLVEIQAPSVFGALGKLLGGRIGFNWAYVVADQAGDRFTLDPARLLRTIDLVA